MSDVHFAEKNNSIEEKKEKLCAAIQQDAHIGDSLIFLFSGDIAQTGAEAEYKIAAEFFNYIRKSLAEAKQIRSYFFFVPRNHDCDFSDKRKTDDYELRRNAIIADRSKASDDYISVLCEKQTNYRTFLNTVSNNDPLEGNTESEGNTYSLITVRNHPVLH